ncbi:uncharacterized protein [Nicotiana tomentosiformis]|uniref:uncharacterized protein n=1 Tax=Nicotiana tomentosiformis TaxID=4098 RepID=UPI00388CD9DC
MPFPEKWNMKRIGKDVVMRPLSSEEETSIPAPKPAKDKKRKKTSTSEDPEPKKKAAHKPKKNIILLTEDYVQRLREEDEEEEEDDSGLVARVEMSTESPKATESVKATETPSRDEGVSGRDLGEVPESSRIEDASHYNEPTVGTAVGASALHREVFSQSRAELSRYEADIQRLTEERNALNLLGGQKEEKIKDLRAKLSTTHKDQTDLSSREHEADAGALASSDDDDDDDDDGSKSGSKNGKDLDGEEAAPEEN